MKLFFRWSWTVSVINDETSFHVVFNTVMVAVVSDKTNFQVGTKISVLLENIVSYKTDKAA